MVDDDDDRRVKDLVAAAQAGDANLDPQTAADLARWFGLPSFQQVDEGEVKPRPLPAEDPDVVARRKAIEAATAAVDPAFCDSLYTKWAGVRELIKFEAADLARIDPSISAIDPVLVAKADVGEPREVDLPMGLFDDLRECTPQAVLRDLHRPETEFFIHMEVDPMMASVMPIDARMVVRDALATRPGGGINGPRAIVQVREALAPLVQAKREKWSEIRTPGRRVRE